MNLAPLNPPNATSLEKAQQAIQAVKNCKKLNHIDVSKAEIVKDGEFSHIIHFGDTSEKDLLAITTLLGASGYYADPAKKCIVLNIGQYHKK